MRDNQDLLLFTAVIVTSFSIFIINRLRVKKKKRRRQVDSAVMRRSIVNALADMESNGVYFDRENIKLPSKVYTDKFKRKMKSKS